MRKPRTDRLARLAAACAAMLLVQAAVAAEKGVAGWGLPQLMQELGQVKRAEARFTERRYLKVLNAPRVSSGTLIYTAPDKLEKRTLRPKPEALLVDGDVLTVEPAQGKKRTLKLGDYPVLRAFVESIRATLGGDAATLERYYKVDLEGGRERWELFLAPREPGMSQVISQIRIAGGGARVGLIEVQEAKGDRTVTTVVGEAR